MLKIGAIVKQMDYLPPADLARVEMLGRIVKGPVHLPSPTHVWVEFEAGTVELLPKEDSSSSKSFRHATSSLA